MLRGDHFQFGFLDKLPLDEEPHDQPRLAPVTSEQKSVAELGDPDKEGLTTFQQILPRQAETVQSVLPRGLRYALDCQLGGDKNGKTNIQMERQAKVYTVGVDPDARKNMVKEILRFGNSAEPPDNTKNYRLPQVRFGNPVQDAIVDERHNRQKFRLERLSKFQKHRHVPALLTDRLLPCWRAVQPSLAKQDTPAGQALRDLEVAVGVLEKHTQERTRAGKQYRKVARRKCKDGATGSGAFSNAFMPTLSTAMKNQDRTDYISPPEWNLSGTSSSWDEFRAFETGCNGPSHDVLRERERNEREENRRQWLTHDMVPPGKALTEVDEEIKEIREQARIELAVIREIHHERLESFKKRPEHSAMKSFEKYCKDFKAKAKLVEKEEEARRKAEEEKPSCFASNLAGMLSLGLSKNREESAPEKLPTL